MDEITLVKHTNDEITVEKSALAEITVDDITVYDSPQGRELDQKNG